MHSNVRFEEKLRCALATELGRLREGRSGWFPAGLLSSKRPRLNDVRVLMIDRQGSCARLGVKTNWRVQGR